MPFEPADFFELKLEMILEILFSLVEEKKNSIFDVFRKMLI